MTDPDRNAQSPEIIDEQATITLAQLCRSCGVDAEIIEAMVDHGILDPVESSGHHHVFAATSLRRTRVVVRLQRDLGVNLPGAALALDLLEQINELRTRLHDELDRSRR